MKRVAHVQGIMVRRLGQMALSRDWGVCHGQWAEAACTKRRMASAAARLTKPALAACLSHWRRGLGG